MILLNPRMLALAIGATLLTGCFEKPTASSTYENSLIKVSTFEVPASKIADTPEFYFTGRAGVSEEVVNSNISAQVARVNVVDGQSVTKGEVLFEIDDSTLKSNLLVSEQRYQLAKKAYRSIVKSGAQVKSLVAEDGPGKILVVQANDMVRSAHSEYVAALTSRNSDLAAFQARTSLAPIDGVVEHLSVSAGEHLTPGKPLMVIRPKRNRWVEVLITDADYGLIIGKKSLPPEIFLTFSDGSSAIGKMERPSFVDDNRMNLRFIIDQSNSSFISGDDVQVKVIGEPIFDLTLIPLQALKTNADGYYVFVVGRNDDRVDIREVEVVEWTGSVKYVRSGLKPGDRVVVSNFAKLRPGGHAKVIPGSY